MTLSLVAGGVAIIGIAAAGMTARGWAVRRGLIAARIAQLAPEAAGVPPESALRRIGARLAATPVIGATEVGRLRQNLYAAGFVGQAALEQFIGLKLVLAAALTGFAVVVPGVSGFAPDLTTHLLLITGGMLAGLRGPDLVIGARARARRDLVDRGLPDALDLLVVCCEAGIGLELAVERVATELREVHPALAQELTVTVSEMRLLPDPLGALRGMGERMRLDSVRTIASTLAQTLKYGTPLGKALRTLTADFRLIRQTRIEEKAARLPVLMTIPMIAFILPATTLIVAGPAFLQLITALSDL